MKNAIVKNWLAASMILFAAAIFCLPAFAQSPQVSTDKGTYLQGEKIQVRFSGSPGHKKDWICISPKNSPDDQAGDYDYIPQGATQGLLTFNAPSPREYEARAYYNYSRNGYVVSARCSFTVASSGAGQNPFMERKINTNDPNETSLPSDKGLVYLFNESVRLVAGAEIQVTADGKPLIGLSPGQYFVYPAAGTVQFTADTFFQRNPSGQMEEVKAMNPGKAAVDVKPGHVYYLSVKAAPMGPWMIFLDLVPHEEGAKIIKDVGMTLTK